MLSQHELENIAINLKPEDLLNLCSANKQLKSLCDDDDLWMQKLHIDYPDASNNRINPPMSYKQLYMNRYELPKKLKRNTDHIVIAITNFIYNNSKIEKLPNNLILSLSKILFAFDKIKK
jgi:hypothetical protein